MSFEKRAQPEISGCGDSLVLEIGCLPDHCVRKADDGKLVISATEAELQQFGIVRKADANDTNG